MAGQISPNNVTPTSLLGSLTCRKAATRDRWLYFPSEGRRAEDFFARKIRWLRPGLNPQTWVPEASMLTTRPEEATYIVPTCVNNNLTLPTTRVTAPKTVIYLATYVFLNVTDQVSCQPIHSNIYNRNSEINPLVPELFFKFLHTLYLKCE
jgi:hypothetical protein